jgi:hypothetical protein
VESWGSDGGADENGQESGCGGCGEDHFGIWEGLSWSTPRVLNVIGQVRGTPTNFGASHLR